MSLTQYWNHNLVPARDLFHLCRVPVCNILINITFIQKQQEKHMRVYTTYDNILVTALFSPWDSVSLAISLLFNEG